MAVNIPTVEIREAETKSVKVSDSESEQPSAGDGDGDQEEHEILEEELESQKSLQRELEDNWRCFRNGAVWAAREWDERRMSLAALLAEGIRHMERRAHNGRDEPSDEVLDKMLRNIGLGPQHLCIGDLSIFESWLQDLVRMLICRVIYPQMISAAEKYPNWLQEQGELLSEASRHRYQHQHELLKKAMVLMEEEKNSQNKPQRNRAFARALKVICKSLELGDYPSEIQNFEDSLSSDDEKEEEENEVEGAGKAPVASKEKEETVCLCQAAVEANNCSLM